VLAICVGHLVKEEQLEIPDPVREYDRDLVAGKL
jgi:hypothetical protein